MFARLLRLLRREETITTESTIVTSRPIVRLEDIPTWIDLFNENKQEFDSTLSGIEDPPQYAVIPEINRKVSIYGANMTSLDIDGIVRSTDTSLTSTDGISGTISSAAGPALDEELMTLGDCQEGEAKTTSGHDLPARYIVHTVGTTEEQPEILESCYKSCLEQMRLKDMRTLAFCCISTGFHGYPNDAAVHVALKTVRHWLEELKTENKLDEINRIIFCLFSEEDVFLYSVWMQIYFPCTSEPEPDPVVSYALASSAADNIAALENSIKLDQTNQKQLCPLPGFIELTTEPDMLGLDLDDDPSTTRAKMPCGHVIGSDSMADYFKSTLRTGDFKFVCPAHGCDQTWEYFLVRHVVSFSDDEMCQFEKNLENNFLERRKGSKRCPGCNTWCVRAPGVGKRVRCPMCTASRRKKFDFCWICLNEWKRFLSSGSCGNRGCSGKDNQSNKTLADCPTKRINLCYGCPTIRACPQCRGLIEHQGRCGHMSCFYCRCKFCFICLKEHVNGIPQCNFLGTCTVAPRQAS